MVGDQVKNRVLRCCSDSELLTKYGVVVDD